MKSTQKKVSGADLPTPVHGFFFELKAWRLRLSRSLKNGFHSVPKYKPGQTWENAHCLSQSTSLLWSGEETAQMLIAGKIQNLRLSVRHLDGIIVPAGQTFSFWKQIGRITRSRGYAQGRELREGCIIPTIGGGICQLSNAIYDAALKAGLEIVERHRHSQIIAGSLAEQGRDATVFWNYLDLRLRAPYTWQLQVQMDEKHLSVSIWTQDKQAESPQLSPKQMQAHAIGDCTQCGRTDCYLHVGDIPLAQHKTWLVTEEEWPEFALWRKQNQNEQDKIISTVAQRENAPSPDTRLVNFYSRLMRRYHLRQGHPLPVAQNSRYGRIARHFAKKLKASDTYLVIPQDLLPWLWMAGELRGRQYDVLMNALPISEIQSRLDNAAELYPQIKPLTNFRAGDVFAKSEHDALTHARHWITPHAEILKLAGNKGVALPWILPGHSELPHQGKDATDSPIPKIMLPAPSLARKGVYELREALRMLPCPVQLILPSRKLEAPDIWDGLDVQYCTSLSEGVRQADVVVLPAWIEHQPQGLLQAVALGKPVIATPACGLTSDLAWRSVEAGNVEDLARAIGDVVGGEVNK